MMKCSSENHIEYRKALLAQESILKQLNTEFFDEFPKWLTHEDFQPDNILFNVDCVSAVIDFDCSCFRYIWHDVGRAILSFAIGRQYNKR